MVSDLYLSINENRPTHQQDGLDFMVANDINNDHSMSLEDFEDIFVKHLSSHDNTGYSLTNPYVTAVSEEVTTPGRVSHPYPGNTGGNVVIQNTSVGGYAQPPVGYVRR